MIRSQRNTGKESDSQDDPRQTPRRTKSRRKSRTTVERIQSSKGRERNQQTQELEQWVGINVNMCPQHMWRTDVCQTFMANRLSDDSHWCSEHVLLTRELLRWLTLDLFYLPGCVSEPRQPGSCLRGQIAVSSPDRSLRESTMN